MIKLCSILFDKKGDMHRYTIMGNFVCKLIKRISLAILISSKSNQIKKLIGELNPKSKMVGQKLNKAVN